MPNNHPPICTNSKDDYVNTYFIIDFFFWISDLYRPVQACLERKIMVIRNRVDRKATMRYDVAVISDTAYEPYRVERSDDSGKSDRTAEGCA